MIIDQLINVMSPGKKQLKEFGILIKELTTLTRCIKFIWNLLTARVSSINP